MESKTMHRANVVWTNFCRFALGIVFIFSGFVKADDPYGMVYKLQDYFVAFGWTDFMPSFMPLFLSCLLAVFEFTLGVYLFFGIRKRLTSIAVALVMLVMTPFTLYLAIANPVSDCGCFGDALKLTNWETFWKNVVLLVFALWLFKHYRLVVKFISKKNQWIISMYGILYSVAIVSYCIFYLPIFDFRPYYIGANIKEQMSIPEDEEPPVYDTTFILEKDGVQKEFTLDNYPDSTWTFVDSRLHLVKEGYVPPIADFSLRLYDTGDEVTDFILSEPGYTFLLISPSLGDADDGSIDLINEIYDYSMENGYPFYCVTPSPEEEVEQWKDRTGAEYPYLIGDETVLKTVVRSNPGLVLLKEGTIINKWSFQNLPDEYALNGRLEEIPLGQIQQMPLTHRVGIVFLWFIVPLAVFTLLDNWYHLYQARKNRRAQGA